MDSNLVLFALLAMLLLAAFACALASRCSSPCVFASSES